MDADIRKRVDQLQRLPLFRHLPEAKVEELSHILSVQTVPADTVVFEEGSPGDTMFLLAQGRIRIEKAVDAGGYADLAVLSPGDVFGEMALIERLPRSARAVADIGSTLFVLGGPALKQWLGSDPLSTVSFFVEMLRVLSHRLRRSSQSLVLLHDVGDLASRRFDDEATFLAAVLHRLIRHLEGEWSAAAYVYNAFNDEVARVATAGLHAARLPDRLSIDEGSCSSVDAAAFSVALAGKTDIPGGFLLARNELAMSPAEKSEAEVALAAVGHLVGLALQNIQQDVDERLRLRLHHQRADDPC